MSNAGHVAAEQQHERDTRNRRPEQDAAGPVALPGDPAALLRHLQRTAGNRAVNALLRQYRAQGYAAATAQRAALAPGAVQRCGGTPCACSPEERQEHAAGDAVRRMASGTTASGATAHPPHETAAGETTPDGANEELAQAAPEVGLEGGPLSPALTSRINSKRGGGAPLDEATRTGMEAALGTSLADVRVHSDGESHALNRAVSARAFTTGSDVFLGAEASAADSGLMAHELTHVVQQRGLSASSGPLTVGPAGDSYEQEAEAMAAQAGAHEPAQRSLGAAIRGQTIRRSIIQRDADSDDYKQGYQDGASGAASQPGPRDGDALDDYNAGYAAGQGQNQSAAPSPDSTPSTTPSPGPSQSTTPASGSDQGNGPSDVADLDQQYNAAVQAGDWQTAAEKLNAFNREDIQSRLAQLAPDQIASLHQGALDNPRVGPQSQVAQMTAPDQPGSNQNTDPDAQQAGQPADPNAQQPGQPDQAAGASGPGPQPPANPYAAGSDEANAWQRGYNDGQAQPGASLPPPSNLADSAQQAYLAGVQAANGQAPQVTPNPPDQLGDGPGSCAYEPNEKEDSLTSSGQVDSPTPVLLPSYALLWDFGVRQTDLKPAHTEFLSQLIAAANLNSPTAGATVQIITGHTDCVDTETVNSQLRESRAEAVAQFLITRGVQPEYIKLTQAAAAGSFVADNTSRDGRARNRSAEMTLELTPTPPPRVPCKAQNPYPADDDQDYTAWEAGYKDGSQALGEDPPPSGSAGFNTGAYAEGWDAANCVTPPPSPDPCTTHPSQHWSLATVSMLSAGYVAGGALLGCTLTERDTGASRGATFFGVGFVGGVDKKMARTPTGGVTGSVSGGTDFDTTTMHTFKSFNTEGHIDFLSGDAYVVSGSIGFAHFWGIDTTTHEGISISGVSVGLASLGLSGAVVAGEWSIEGC